MWETESKKTLFEDEQNSGTQNFSGVIKTN